MFFVSDGYRLILESCLRMLTWYTLGSPTDIAQLYEDASDEDQQYIQNLALFLTGFLGVHLKVRKLTLTRPMPIDLPS